MFHLLSHTDLCYTYGKDSEKSSDPVRVLRRHAVHLFRGGYGDCTVDVPLKDYSVLLYSRDSDGKRMIIRTTKLNGTIRNNLMAVVDECAEADTRKASLAKRPFKESLQTPLTAKQIDRMLNNDKTKRTLWIVAEVVPTKAEAEHLPEATSSTTNEAIAAKARDEMTAASAKSVPGDETEATDESDDWDAIANEY